MTQLGFYYNSKNCTGCKTCQIACKDKNGLVVGELFRKVYSFETGIYPNTKGYYLSLGCNHCEEPKCATNCPTGAIYKRSEDGLVVQNRDKCIGCKMCMWSCPYDKPQYIEAQGHCGKCDGCADLVDQGLNPACVDACPMRVIEFGDIEELRAKHGNNTNLTVLKDALFTKPSITIDVIDEAKF